jgi:hypothetical protein
MWYGPRLFLNGTAPEYTYLPHGILDPTFRPPTFYRLGIREIRRPSIAIEILLGSEERPVLGKSRGKIRRRNNDNEGLVEDIPPATRQATPRKIRPRANDSRTEKVAAEPTVGKVVASGHGWYTIDVDDD